MDKAIEFDSLRDLLDNARSITQMPAFKRWQEIATEQIDLRGKEALKPMKSSADAMERNYANGEAAGIMNAIGLWTLLIDGLEVELNRIKEELEDEQEG